MRSEDLRQGGTESLVHHGAVLTRRRGGGNVTGHVELGERADVCGDGFVVRGGETQIGEVESVRGPVALLVPGPFTGDQARPSPRPPPSPNSKHRIGTYEKDGALVTSGDLPPEREEQLITELLRE